MTPNLKTLKAFTPHLAKSVQSVFSASGYEANDTGDIVCFLKTKTADELMAATVACPCPVVIDGDVIPGRPRDLYLSGQIQNVDLLLGFNADEGYMFLSFLGAPDFQVKERAAGEGILRLCLMMMNTSPTVAENVVAKVSPLYFDQCGDDTEKLTRATSDLLAHVMMEPPMIWAANEHSRALL